MPSHRCSRKATPAEICLSTRRSRRPVPRPAHLTRFVAFVPRSDRQCNPIAHQVVDQQTHLTHSERATSRAWDNDSPQTEQADSYSYSHNYWRTGPARQTTNDFVSNSFRSTARSTRQKATVGEFATLTVLIGHRQRDKG